MMKAFRLAVPALSIGLAIGCAGAPPNQSGSPVPTPSSTAAGTPTPSPAASTVGAFTLQGRVYDDDLAPASGVRVAVTQNGTAVSETTTDADGRYSLAVAAGAYVVQASKATYAPREQAVNLSGPVILDFGGQTTLGNNPYFLTQAPEIARVEVLEEKSGGPLTLKLHMSEPLTAKSQTAFADRLELESPAAEPFLRVNSEPEPYLRTVTSWDASGQVFSLRYDQPYLAGETYTLKLRQRPLDRLDSVTRLPAYEDMGIVDAEGSALGMGRADYAFLRPILEPMAFADLANKDLGYTPAIRRWNLTHAGSFAFRAAADTAGPGLESVKVEADEDSNGALFDVMELRFTEPMRVVKDRDTEFYTRLDRDKEMVILNVSTDARGSAPKPLAAPINDIKFSRSEPRLVYVYFPAGTFKDQNWVEVTLGGDVRDPAGNKPDPAKSRVAGTVG
jgi:hypothetical protein